MPTREEDLAERRAELLAAIELSRRAGVGAKRFKALIARHGSPLRALGELEAVSARGDQGRKSPLSAEQLARLAALCAPVGATWCGAPDYPWNLEDLSEPPPYLFFEGPLWPLPPLAVAIVGPRRCSPEGEALAGALAAGLAARGVPIVSGGALGVDAAAHLGALSVGGHTVLVAATGIDRCYPPTLAALHRQVARRGCLLTELLPGTPPRRDFFPTRNRIIAGLADALIVIEGRAASGTASTAQHALRLGRPIFTVAADPGRPLGQLPRALLVQGAIPLDGPAPELVLRRIKASGGVRRTLNASRSAPRSEPSSSASRG